MHNSEIPLPSRTAEILEGYVQIDVFAEPGLARQFAGKIEELSGDQVHVTEISGISTYRPLAGSQPKEGTQGEIAIMDEVLLSFPWPAHAVDTLAVVLAADHQNDTFVMEVSDPRDVGDPSSFRIRIASSPSRVNAVMDDLAAVGVGRIENYDRCFFLYEAGENILSIETIITPDQAAGALDVAQAHGMLCVLDALTQAVELKGQRGRLDTQIDVDRVFRAYRDMTVLFERED